MEMLCRADSRVSVVVVVVVDTGRDLPRLQLCRHGRAPGKQVKKGSKDLVTTCIGRRHRPGDVPGAIGQGISRFQSYYRYAELGLGPDNPSQWSQRTVKTWVRGKTCFTIPLSMWVVAIYDNGLLIPPDQPSSRNSPTRPRQGQRQDLKDLI